MGQDISKSHFTEDDFKKFGQALRSETATLVHHFKEKNFGSTKRMIGMELEAWLVDNNFSPAPENETFLKKLNDPLVVPELAAFNIEINTPPEEIKKDCLKNLKASVEKTLNKIHNCCQNINLNLITIGSLPTLDPSLLTLDHLSNKERYKALDEQIHNLRSEKDFFVSINGEDEFKMYQANIMLESAATSMQIHFQLEPELIGKTYNSSIITSAPMVGACSNSPFLFGKDLWQETRIPIFEEAIKLPGFHVLNGEDVNRVTMGSGYVHDSIIECFIENLDFYPTLLPIHFETEKEKLSHLKLHNGTIWRWNRPIVSLNQNHQPSFRIEHRSPPAGPTLIDMIANVAFYIGCTYSLLNLEKAPKDLLDFQVARNNFYEAAKFGLDAQITWIDGKEYKLKDLLIQILVPMAKEGLRELNIDGTDISYYMNEVFKPRIVKEKTGSHWQKAFIQKHGKDFAKLTKEYFKWQTSGQPVHEWTIV